MRLSQKTSSLVTLRTLTSAVDRARHCRWTTFAQHFVIDHNDVEWLVLLRAGCAWLQDQSTRNQTNNQLETVNTIPVEMRSESERSERGMQLDTAAAGLWF